MKILCAHTGVTNTLSVVFSEQLSDTGLLTLGMGEEYTLEGFGIDVKKFAHGLGSITDTIRSKLNPVDSSELSAWMKKNKKTIRTLERLGGDDLSKKTISVPMGISNYYDASNVIRDKWASLDIVSDLEYCDRLFKTVLICASQNDPTVLRKVKQARSLLTERVKKVRDLLSLVDSDVKVPESKPFDSQYREGADFVKHLDVLNACTPLVLNKVALVQSTTESCVNTLNHVLEALDAKDVPTNILNNAFRADMVVLAESIGDYLTAFGKSALIIMACQHNWIINAEGLG